MRYRFGGLIVGGAYTWRGLFSEFNGILFTRVKIRDGGKSSLSTLYYLQISYHLSTLKHLKLINVLNKTINLFFFCFSAVVIVKQEPFERSLASME